jgi:hypothetical protein
MTTRELIQVAGQHPLVLGGFFAGPPLVSYLLGRVHGQGKGGQSPWKYLYAVLVYLVCLPGMLSAVLTGYALFFTRENLLDVNLLVYFLPLASMVVTLVFIRKNVTFDEVPGFDRLSGLMVMIGCSFGVALAISKLQIFLFFGASFDRFLLLALGIFGLIKWGMYGFFRRKEEPKQTPPSMPGLGGQ